MIKFRLHYDKDREEEFLNVLSKRGYELKRFCLGFYKFVPCNPGEYTYRIDLINDKTNKEFRDYVELVEESGAELVQTWGVWAIFRKKGEFELYTDTEDMINQYIKIRRLFSLLGFSEFCFSVGQWERFFSDDNHSAFFCALLLTTIGIAFIYQAIKCTNKIAKLRKNIKIK